MRKLTITSILLALASCGSAYKSPSVTNDGSRVRVVELTGETVLQANQSTYQPRTLPQIFSATAGSGAGLRGAGTLPDGAFVPQNRPATLQTRIPPATNPGAYTIGIGDVVLLATPSMGTTVEELSGLLAAQNSRQGYTVQDDGSINIPNVGRVRIAGMTIEEAEAELFQRLVENQLDPTFSLEVSEFNSRKISVGGAVAAPVVAPITITPLYLNEALALAGGITVEDQDFASVRIYRDGTLYQIPLTEMLRNSTLQRLRLVDGDSVYIDTEYELEQAQAYFEQQITLTQVRQQARDSAIDELTAEVALRRGELDEARENFLTRTDLGAEDRDYVYLTGEVDTQSRYPLPYGQQATLADALFDAAGGIPLETGDVSQIYVLRGSSDPREFGAVTAWRLDGRNAANLILATRFELRPDDIVFVAEQPVTRWARVVDQITPSLITTGVSAASN